MTGSTPYQSRGSTPAWVCLREEFPATILSLPFLMTSSTAVPGDGVCLPESACITSYLDGLCKDLYGSDCLQTCHPSFRIVDAGLRKLSVSAGVKHQRTVCLQFWLLWCIL